MPTEALAGRTETADDSTEFLSVDFDLLTMEDVLGALSRVTASSPYSYVVTPNVDHIVRLVGADAQDAAVRAAYDGAAMRLCDSRVLARLARTGGLRLPVVPGSELTVRLFDGVIRSGDTVAIVGADERLVDSLRARAPGVRFRHHEPPMGMRRDEAAMARAAAFVLDARARFTFLAVGSPQQELLAHRVLSRGGATGCALCIGAALEFASGQRKRAPRAFQRFGLEWAYRLLQDPRRLWRRYLVDGARIFPILLKWRRKRSIVRLELSRTGTMM